MVLPLPDLVTLGVTLDFRNFGRTIATAFESSLFYGSSTSHRLLPPIYSSMHGTHGYKNRREEVPLSYFSCRKNFASEPHQIMSQQWIVLQNVRR